MQLDGTIISYSVKDRGGYIDAENFPNIFYHLSDLPFGYIHPTIGERVQFVLSTDGFLHATQIERLDVVVPEGRWIKLKAFKYQILQHYHDQPIGKQKFILIGIIFSLLLILSLMIFGFVNLYQSHQIKKAQLFQIEQQQAIEKQKIALGELEFDGLSENARRNIDGQVYGTVKERTELVTSGIDKQNGLLPVNMAKFKCDTRTQCYQMRSYEEALYFHRHCRTAKLDSNGNGIPCENEFKKAK